jgi:hypothetical protein
MREIDFPPPQQRFLGLFMFHISTLLHVLVPEDHHQVDNTNTKILFTNMDPYQCTLYTIVTAYYG